MAAQRILNRQHELVTERVLSAVRGAVTTYATISASQNEAALTKPDHRQQDCDRGHKGQQGRQHLSGQFGSSSPVFEHSADHGRLLAAPKSA